ncbi:hypothetical protein [Compostibacter hankyongensis]|uniref:Uncharacterized protein n=1 Tax=Compostibacter hankyongensis TaxID=1007089 RepID=A0ABP8G981_9BACT
MSRLKIYSTNVSRESILRERAAAYQQLSSREKIEQLFSLIQVSVSLNGGKPLKYPQGKGVVISRKNH